MLENYNPSRYSIVEEKNKREMVMLIGSGCKWKKCKFCDYHLYFYSSEEVFFELNKTVLEKVTGIHKKLAFINSGSFTELDNKTMDLIEKICIEKNIQELHFESHYLFRKSIPELRKRFEKHRIKLIFKCGVETFDIDYRENILVKGMKDATAEDVAKYFEEVCLLFGLDGQSEESMRNDIRIGLAHFDRICINIMGANGSSIKPNKDTIKIFLDNIYPEIKDDERIDILLQNTDFGVGGATTLTN